MLFFLHGTIDPSYIVGEIMGYTRGKPLTPEQKQSVVSVKNYFDRNKKVLLGWNDSCVQMTADALEIARSTVERILSNYKKNPESINALIMAKGRPSYTINDSYESAIRSYIRAANMSGQYVSLDTINKFLAENSNEEKINSRTLGRTLNRWGFEFGKGTRTQHLKETNRIIALRRKYLRKMRKNRIKNSELTKRPEVYLDESYINKNHSNDYTWYSSEDGPLIQKPTGKGERLIIINAITRDGWVSDAKVVFKSTRKTGDYHGQMNAELFEKWFKEKLLPNIPNNSNIIMDNASYHNLLSEISPPTTLCSKEKIKIWFNSNDVSYNKDSLKAELIDILEKLSLDPIYSLDELAKQEGHLVIRTPPYHPELQPIEICWGVLKNYVARNCDFTMDNLHRQLENSFKKVTNETCQKVIQKIRVVEDKFWDDDLEIENLMISN